MKILKRILIVVILGVVIIQFFHPRKNQSAIAATNHINKLYPVPENVNIILIKACNDCHSNNTVYPWYNNIQPVAWWLESHINDGKKHFNIDEFATYRIARQYKKMQDCIDEIKQGDMPLESYTWIHKEAKLTNEEKEIIYHWCTSVRDSIKAKYPADSLIMPKKKK
jgi:hypothetical protein